MNRRQALRVGGAIGAGLYGAWGNVGTAAELEGNGIAEIRMKSARIDELRRF